MTHMDFQLRKINIDGSFYRKEIKKERTLVEQFYYRYYNSSLQNQTKQSTHTLKLSGLFFSTSNLHH